MRITQTQLEQVIEKIEQDGEVSNFWAIDNRILRLAGYIYFLRNEGYVFETKYGYDQGLGGRNMYYYKIN